MEAATYTFNGVKFSDISGADLPPELRELYVKEYKSIQRTINSKRVTKDKRAERIQHCYAVILKKGLPTFTVPSAQDLDFSNFKSYEMYKNYISKISHNLSDYIGFADVKLYAEPLRCAISMFKY